MGGLLVKTSTYNDFVRKKNGIGNGEDLNNYTDTGFYDTNPGGSGSFLNAPENASVHGVLIVMNYTESAGSPVLQLLYNTSNECYIRMRWVDTWNRWKKISS